MKIIDGIQLVTFDLDGTLIDDEWAHRKAKEEIARDIGAQGDLDIEYYIGRSNRKFWRHVIDDCGGRGDIEALVSLQFEKVLQYIMEANQPESDGISEAVRYFRSRGIKVAITSGSDLPFIDGVLEHLHLSDCFDMKICKNYVKQVKPAPDIYLAAQHLSGIAGRYAVGVEDSDSGCEALHAAGMRCVGYTNHGENPQGLKNADIKIATMLELLDIIRP